MVLKRILEAMGQFLPFAAVLMLIVFFGNYIAAHNGGHYLYHWLHEELYDPASAEYDAIIAGKSGYLNLPFFIIRMFAYFAIWIGFTFLFRKLSLKEDIEGGNANYLKAKKYSATFLVLFVILQRLLGILSCQLIHTGIYSSDGTPLRECSSVVLLS